jgi:hypothetical protein
MARTFGAPLKVPAGKVLATIWVDSISSDRESELQEVNNKLAALRKAIELAKEIR